MIPFAILWLLAGLLFGEALTLHKYTGGKMTAIDSVVYVVVLFTWPVFMPFFIYRSTRKK